MQLSNLIYKSLGINIHPYLSAVFRALMTSAQMVDINAPLSAEINSLLSRTRTPI